MRVVVDRDPNYAPCSYILYPVNDDGEWFPRTEPNLVFDSDWGFPSLASLFGYAPCTNGCTDGTVECECTGRTPSDMISEAMDILDANLGRIVESDDYAEYLEV